MARWMLTKHALGRAQEMGLSVTQIAAIIEDSELDWESRGRRVAAAGQYAVVYDRDRMQVVTILFRRQDRWQRQVS